MVSLFTPPQGGGMTYLIGIFVKNKLDVLAPSSIFFFLLEACSSAKALGRSVLSVTPWVSLPQSEVW